MFDVTIGAGDVNRDTRLAGFSLGYRAQVRVVVAEAQGSVSAYHVNEANALNPTLTDPYQQRRMLAAHLEPEQAEEAAGVITSTNQQAGMLAAQMEAALRTGDLDRAKTLAAQAEEVTRAITNRGQQAQMLAAVTEVALRTGDLDRAETIAEAIIDPYQRACSLADVARNAEPNRSRSLLARALNSGHWKASVEVLVQIDPAAVITVADEYLSVTSSPVRSLPGR